MRDLDSKDVLTFTLGELYPEGGGIEVLQGNRLVYWSDAGEQFTSTLQLHGRNYVAAPVDPTLVDVLRFPATTEDFISIDALVASVTQIMANFAGIEEPTQLLLAVFILSTWVADCVPTSPLLNLWGPIGTESTLIEVLSCLCRRPLIVSDTSIRELCALPTNLCPTLIVTQPSRRAVVQLVAASTAPSISLLRGGRLLSLRNAAVACTRDPLPVPVLAISLLPNSVPYHRISNAEADELTTLTPRLLRYRLSQHAKVTCSNFDCPSFAAETRTLARVLGAAVEGSSQLQARIIAALQSLDEQQKADHSQQLAALVVEALLALCRADRPFAYVDEIARMVNAILLGRHEHPDLSAKKIGAILRNQLGLHAERRGPGYQLVFDYHTRERIRRLADNYSVLTLQTDKSSGAAGR